MALKRAMESKVIHFVNLLDKNGSPLDPIHPAYARKLLKEGLAKPVFKLCIRKKVFVIKLTSDKRYQAPTGQYLMGIDLGAGTLGSSVVTEKGDVLYQAETIVRNDIHSKMVRRAAYRRNRRYRKTRYRPPRFLKRGSDRILNPTLNSKFNSHIKEIEYLNKIFPISNFTYEKAKFDIHEISKGRELKNWEYQKGDMSLARAWIRKC